MALDYDHFTLVERFPADFLPPVVAAEAEAQRSLRTALLGASGDRRSGHYAVSRYVTIVTCAFAHQVCSAARDRRWPIERIDSLVDEFQRRASIHVFSEFDLTKLWSEYRFFDADVQPIVRNSTEWDAHQAERAELAGDRGARCGDGSALEQPGAMEGPAKMTGVGRTDTTPVPPVAVGAPRPIESAAAIDALLPGRALVDTFKERVQHETGLRITDTDVVVGAGYGKKSRNLLSRFIQNPHGREKHVQKFNAVLSMEPSEFLTRIRRSVHRSSQ